NHFKETRDSKRVLENQKGLVQCISEKEIIRQELEKKKEILLSSECDTMDYGVKEVWKQAKYSEKNYLKLPKPLVQSKTLAMVINNRLDESDQDMTKIKTQVFYFNKKFFWSNIKDRGFITNIKDKNAFAKENLKFIDRRKRKIKEKQVSYKEEKSFKRQIRRRVIEGKKKVLKDKLEE
ncbi:4639_t:CDS:2, partial [Gigaspora margarita]